MAAEQRRQESVERLRALGLLDAAPARPSWPDRTVDALAGMRRAGWRGRRILAPFAVCAALAALGWWGTIPNIPPVAPLVVWLGAGGVAWRYRLRARLHRVVERRYAAVCATAGAVWLVGAAVFGPGAVDSLLVAGWAILSLPWWVHHWPRPRVEVPDVDPIGDVIVQRWDDNVVPHIHALTGAHLLEPVPIEHGVEYRVQGVPGRDTINVALGQLAGIASGLVVPAVRIVLEPHPVYRDTDPNQGRLRVLRTSPVRDTVIYDRPRVRDGKVELGPYADGMDDAVWRIYSENSMWGGFVLGGTGSGKSRLLETIALGARHMTTLGQPTMVIYVDGQAGASSTLLWRHASLKFGPDRLHEVLDAVEREMEKRQKWNVAWGLDGFTPGLVPAGAPHSLTGVLLIADECHKVFRFAAARWADVAREGRKLGIGLVGASQVNDLSAFGNNDALRSSLLTGNGLAFRTPTADAQRLIPGLLIDPAALPAIPGYGYKIATPQSGERTAPFRARYLPKRADPALPEGAVPAEDWFERTPDAELDPLSARALGDLYVRRHQLAQQARAAILAEIEGRPPAEINGVTPPEPGERVVIEKPSRTAEVIVAVLTERGPTSRADLDAEVRRAYGTGPDAVQKALQGLLVDGAVARTGRGVYARVGA